VAHALESQEWNQGFFEKAQRPTIRIDRNSLVIVYGPIAASVMQW
jgi:hypothetical protein